MSDCKHLRRTYRCDIEECADCQMALSDILQEANAKLKAENERLRKALSYYADPNEWSKCDENSHWNLLFNSSHSDGDGYITAKQALEKDVNK